MLNKIIEYLRILKHNRYIKTCIKKGMKIGSNTNIIQGCYFDSDYCFLISIGNNCTLSNRVFILAHDASMYNFLKIGKIAKVNILDNCFIGAQTIILPGVTIGPNAIIGAGSVVTKNIPHNSVAAGNPARIIKTTDDFIQFHKENLKNKKILWLDEIMKTHSDINTSQYVIKKEDSAHIKNIIS